MSVRRPPLMRKRPAAQPGVGAVSATRESTVLSAANSDKDQEFDGLVEQKYDAMSGDIVREFESLLRDEPDLDQATRDRLSQEFSASMRSDARRNQSPLDQIASDQFWEDAVNALKQSGEIADAEANDVVREIAEALKPLQKRETKLALEFGRRLEQDGEQKAVAWLKEQQSFESDDTENEVTDSTFAAPRPMPTDIVKSRSRRLRGPPNRR